MDERELELTREELVGDYIKTIKVLEIYKDKRIIIDKSLIVINDDDILGKECIKTVKKYMKDNPRQTIFYIDSIGDYPLKGYRNYD